MDELINPADRAKIHPEVLRRIEAGVRAGGRVAEVFDRHEAAAVAALARPAEAKKLRGTIDREVTQQLKTLNDFQALKKEITKTGQ
jgi:hypothetical protein